MKASMTSFKNFLLGVVAGLGCLCFVWYGLLVWTGRLPKDAEILLWAGLIIVLLSLIARLGWPYIGGIFAVLVVAFVVAISVWNYLRTDANNYEGSPEYKKVIQFVAQRHNTPAPLINRNPRGWVISFFPAPFGRGGSFFANQVGAECDLIRNPLSFINAYPSKESEHVWREGTMAHEAAHCFDNASRKLKPERWSFVAPHLITTAKISGTDDIEHRLDYILWKEVVADLHLAAYWFAKYPEPDARRYIAEWSKFRRDRAYGADADLEHNTSCWLDAALDKPKPANNADLFQWASELRTTIWADESLTCWRYLKDMATSQEAIAR